MQIHVPEEMGGKLHCFPEGAYDAQIQDCFVGQSKAGNPKLTVKYVITSEPEDGPADPPTTGENVLESFSLLPNAMWNLNDLITSVTDERIPARDFAPEEFEQFCKEALVGAAGRVMLVQDASQGEPRMKVEERSFGG